MMNHEPETVFRTARRQMMTNYPPPLRRRVDSDWRTSIGWWGAVGEFVGFTLIECLTSPVAGLAVIFLSPLLAFIRAASDLFSQTVDALGNKARKSKT